MKILTILTLICISLSLSSQNYKITGTAGKFGLENNKGELILEQKYKQIYKCEYSENHVLAERKRNMYLVNTQTKEVFELAEFGYMNEIDNETCYLKNGKIIRFIKDEKIGAIKFPQKEILKADYSEIRQLLDYQDLLLVNKDNKSSIYNIKTKKFSAWFTIPVKSIAFYLDDGYLSVENGESFPAKINNKWHLIKLTGEKYPIEKYYKKNLNFDMLDIEILLSKQNNKYGYISLTGETVIPFIYADAGQFDPFSNLAYVKIKNKYGYIDSSGKISLPCIYDKAGTMEEGISKVSIKGKEITIDEFGDAEDLLEPEMYERETDKGLYEKYGYINSKGKIVLDFQFEDARVFSFGLAAVNKNGKWGFIAQTCDMIIDFKFEDVKDFSFAYASCKLNGKWGVIDASGNFIIENKYDFTGNYDYRTATVKAGIQKNGEMVFGKLDMTGKTVIDFKYDAIGPTVDSITPLKLNNKWGYFYANEKQIIDFKYEEANSFFFDLAAVKLSGKWGFIDKTGKTVIDFNFDNVSPYYYDLIAVKIGDKWGYIDKTGKTIIEFQFDKADPFYRKTAEVKKANKYFTINKKGECVENCP